MLQWSYLHIGLQAITGKVEHSHIFWEQLHRVWFLWQCLDWMSESYRRSFCTLPDAFTFTVCEMPLGGNHSRRTCHWLDFAQSGFFSHETRGCSGDLCCCKRVKGRMSKYGASGFPRKSRKAAKDPFAVTVTWEAWSLFCPHLITLLLFQRSSGSVLFDVIFALHCLDVFLKNGDMSSLLSSRATVWAFSFPFFVSDDDFQDLFFWVVYH